MKELEKLELEKLERNEKSIRMELTNFRKRRKDSRIIRSEFYIYFNDKYEIDIEIIENDPDGFWISEQEHEIVYVVDLILPLLI